MVVVLVKIFFSICIYFCGNMVFYFTGHHSSSDSLTLDDEDKDEIKSDSPFASHLLTIGVEFRVRFVCFVCVVVFCLGVYILYCRFVCAYVRMRVCLFSLNDDDDIKSSNAVFVVYFINKKLLI